MERIRGLARLLFYLSRLMSFFCLAIAAYALVIITLSTQTNMKGLPVALSNGGFTIFLPFSRIPFLVGDNSVSYIFTSLSIVTLYGIFLWLLGSVFSVFMQKKIFIPKSVKRLKHFYLFNFFVPVIYIICLILFAQEIRDALVIAFLHLMIGVFIYFMAIIFQQGLVLQEEQDLTI
jgi:hypothetical protein